MIYTVTLNPALDKTVILPNFHVGKVNRITSFRLDAGGKGINVSKVIKNLGGESRALGILGGSTGAFIQKSLKENGISTDFTFVQAETRTNLKVIDPDNHTNTDINEPGAPLTDDVQQQVKSLLLSKVQKGDIVVLAGKAPAGAKADIFAVWTRELKEKGVRVFLDADGEAMTEGVKALPYLIKPNDDELARITGKTFSCLEEIVDAAQKLQATGIEKVVVTLGGDGALYVDSEKVIRAHGLKVPVLSTVGAGDSVVAALAFGIDTGMKMEDIVRLSTATGAASVMCSGTQAAEMKDILPLLERVTCEILE